MARSIMHLWYVWFFDLPRDLSAAQIDTVRRRMDARLEHHAKVIGIVMAIVVGGAGFVGGMFFNARPAAWLISLGFNRTVAFMAAAMCASLIGCLVGGCVVYVIALRVGRRRWIVEARKAVRDVGRDVCVSCGYWLRGLNEEVKQCPECGAEREAIADMGGENS